MSVPQSIEDTETTTQAPEAAGSILEPGRNCWHTAVATRMKVLVDTADYFATLAEACQAAQRQILILGWDFDRRERLHRDPQDNGDLPDQLGAFLIELVRRNPRLNLYLLSWDFSMVYAAERELLPALRLRVQAPRRFHFRLDGRHPKGASHHQKLVVIDDRLAFVGGIDLSRWRWDTCEHKPDDPRRIDPDGKPYPPFHDLMVMLEGEVAARLGDLARERWRRSRSCRIGPPRGVERSAWPASVKPDLRDQPVAVARTEPAFAGRSPVREVERLYLDAIAAAEASIYIENQYFTARRLAEALAVRLAEPEGPDVVLVLPEKTGGWLEQMTMDVLRGRVLAQLRDADRHDRLRIYYPYQPGLGGDCISVHAKLLIVDQRLLRVGSSNTSNRSMGLDTECDVAIESAAPDDASATFINDLRNRLLGEHLGCGGEAVQSALSQHQRLIPAVESLRSEQRSLRPLDWQIDSETDDKVPDDYLIDPAEPLSGDYFVSQYVPSEQRPSGRRRLALFIGLILLLLALAAAWRWTPLSHMLAPDRISSYLHAQRSPGIQALLAIGGFVVASLAMVPVTLLAIIGGMVFDGWRAFLYVFSGALLASAIGFSLGRLIGRGTIERLTGSRVERLSQRLAQRGVVAVAVMRLLPVAPFTVFNLVAGSSGLGTRQFIVGSLIGLLPGMAGITLFSHSLWSALTAPSWENVLLAVSLGAVLLLVGWLAKRWLRSG